MIHRTAPAKLNLTLAVLGRRSDGFHELESWVAPIDLADEITVRPADGISLSIEMASLGLAAGAAGEHTLPSDDRNHVFRAAVELALRAGFSRGAAITLTKRVPIGGGMGGGSSDAAATLLALNDLWGLGWSVERLAAVGESIGSDVPFFVWTASPSADGATIRAGAPPRTGPVASRQGIIRGRGERVEPLAGWHGWAALIVPPFGTSTAAVYAAYAAPSFAAPGNRPSAEARRPWQSPPSSAAQLMPLLFNDLEPAAFHVQPRLATLHRDLTRAGGRPVRLTGSGSCLFTLFDDATAAAAWAESVAGNAAGASLHVHRVLAWSGLG